MISCKMEKLLVYNYNYNSGGMGMDMGIIGGIFFFVNFM